MSLASVVSEAGVTMMGAVGAMIGIETGGGDGDTRCRGGLAGVFDLVLGIVFGIAVLFFVPGRDRLVDGERASTKFLRKPFGLSGEVVKES